jgi:hypothetical protein
MFNKMALASATAAVLLTSLMAPAEAMPLSVPYAASTTGPQSVGGADSLVDRAAVACGPRGCVGRRPVGRYPGGVYHGPVRGPVVGGPVYRGPVRGPVVGGPVVRGGVYVRPWVRRPYYGTIVAGVALGTIIAVAAATAPPPPAPNLCWYWVDPSNTQGYWDYCQ